MEALYGFAPKQDSGSEEPQTGRGGFEKRSSRVTGGEIVGKGTEREKEGEIFGAKKECLYRVKRRTSRARAEDRYRT